MFDEKSVLNLEARRQIYDCINKSPGLHFREIQRRIAMATGSIDYHLHFLQKRGLIRSEKSGNFLRYYPSNISYGDDEKDLLNLLRQEKIRHILIYLMENRRPNASKIAEDIGVSQSNLSFYLKRLQEKGIITQKKKGRFRFYQISEKEKIIQCLITYKASFIDDVVDRFIDAWEE